MSLQINKLAQAVQAAGANRGQHMGSQAFADELQSAATQGKVALLVVNNTSQPIVGEITPHAVETFLSGLSELLQGKYAELQSLVASNAVSVAPTLLAAIDEQMSYFSKYSITQAILPAYNDIVAGADIPEALRKVLPSSTKKPLEVMYFNGILERANRVSYLLSYASNGVPVEDLTNRKFSTLLLTDAVNLLASYKAVSTKDCKVFDLTSKSTDIVKAGAFMPRILAEAGHQAFCMKVTKLAFNALLYGTSSYSQQNYTKYGMNDVLIQNTPEDTPNGKVNHIGGSVPFSADSSYQFDSSKGKLPAPNSASGKTMGFMTLDGQSAYSEFTAISDFAFNDGKQFDSLVEYKDDEEKARYIERAKSCVSDDFFYEIKQGSKRITFGTVINFTTGYYDGTSATHMLLPESCECINVQLRSYGVTPDGVLVFLPNLFSSQEVQDALAGISVIGYDLKYRTAVDVQILQYLRARIANVNNSSFSFAAENDDSAKVGEELLKILL